MRTSSHTNTLKVKTACSDLISVDHSLAIADLPSKNDIDGNTLTTDDINKEERFSELPLTSAKEESGKAEEEKPTASVPPKDLQWFRKLMIRNCNCVLHLFFVRLHAGLPFLYIVARRLFLFPRM